MEPDRPAWDHSVDVSSVPTVQGKSFQSPLLTPLPPGLKDQQGHISLMVESPLCSVPLFPGMHLAGEYTTQTVLPVISLLLLPTSIQLDGELHSRPVPKIN